MGGAREEAVVKGGGSMPAASEVFLSPRVIDREAFNDYSASLRRLIEQAGGQAETLRAAATDAAIARDSLKDVAAKHRGQVETAVKVLSTIGERAGEAEKVVALARDAEGAMVRFRAEMEREVEARVSALVARVESIIAGAGERLGRVEAAGDCATEHRSRSVTGGTGGGTELGNMKMEAEQARAGLEAATERAAGRVQRLAEIAEESTLRAHEAAETFEKIVGSGGGTVASLTELLRQLEPWRPLLLERGAAGGLPGPLQEAVDSVRASLTKDLRPIVESIQEASRQLKQAGGKPGLGLAG